MGMLNKCYPIHLNDNCPFNRMLLFSLHLRECSEYQPHSLNYLLIKMILFT